jgi:hypothetical protein
MRMYIAFGLVFIIGFAFIVFKGLISETKMFNKPKNTRNDVMDKTIRKNQNTPHAQVVNAVGANKDSKNVNVEIGAATALAGAALYHQYQKHHKQDDTTENPGERHELLDNEFNELDVVHDDINDMYDPYINDVSYDNDYSSASYDDYSGYSDDVAAYDDFMASMDDDY